MSGIQVLVRPDREARGRIAHAEAERPATEPGDGVVLGRRSRLRRGGDRHPHLSVGGGTHGYRDRGRDAALGGGVGGRPERHREGDAQGDRDDRRRPAVAAFVVRGHLEHVVALRQSGDRVAASGFAARDVRPGRPGLAAVRAAPIRPFGGAGRARAPGQNRLIGGGALPGGEGRAVGLGYHPGGRKRVRMRAGPPPRITVVGSRPIPIADVRIQRVVGYPNAYAYSRDVHPSIRRPRTRGIPCPALKLKVDKSQVGDGPIDPDPRPSCVYTHLARRRFGRRQVIVHEGHGGGARRVDHRRGHSEPQHDRLVVAVGVFRGRDGERLAAVAARERQRAGGEPANRVVRRRGGALGRDRDRNGHAGGRRGVHGHRHRRRRAALRRGVGRRLERDPASRTRRHRDGVRPCAAAGAVHRPHPEPVVGPVGQAGDDVTGGGRAARGDRRPASPDAAIGALFVLPARDAGRAHRPGEGYLGGRGGDLQLHGTRPRPHADAGERGRPRAVAVGVHGADLVAVSQVGVEALVPRAVLATGGGDLPRHRRPRRPGIASGRVPRPGLVLHQVMLHGRGGGDRVPAHADAGEGGVGGCLRRIGRRRFGGGGRCRHAGPDDARRCRRGRDEGTNRPERSEAERRPGAAIGNSLPLRAEGANDCPGVRNAAGNVVSGRSVPDHGARLVLVALGAAPILCAPDSCS